MIQSILNDRFGLDALRPLQKKIIDRVLAGGDALVVMPTGSGKSLCFQLPALLNNQTSGGIGLVFSPLIALMEDQVHALKQRGIRAEYVNSTVPPQERRKRYQRLAAGEYELFYATPERMIKPDFREALSKTPGGVNLLAIDECHCVTKWGHDLRPAYQRIGEFRKQIDNPITIALTATATKPVRDDVRTVIGATLDSMPLFAAPVDRPNLKLRCTEVWDDDDKIEKLQSTLKGIEGTSIVYFTLIKDLERMAPSIMRKMDRPVEVYHGRLPPNERRRVYNQFINATPKENLLLCATNAFGMGVDKSDLRSVIHAQLPGSVEAYHQEVGRAGRDGLPAICKILYAQSDLTIQQEFIRWQNPTPDLIMQTMSAIEARFNHDDFDSDDLRIHVIGKGHAHGLGGGVMDYVLIRLAELGAIELTPIPGNERGQGRYRYVRTINDDEIDADTLSEKLKRDLMRLLDVVNLTKADDIPVYISKYFDLEPTYHSYQTNCQYRIKDSPMSQITEIIIEDAVVGDGMECPKNATVQVHYKGTLMDGTVFDSSYDRGESINFPLNNLIQGWQEGIPGMKIGGKRKLTIPYAKAYGEFGSPPAIPAKADLIFEIELLGLS